MKLNPDFFYFCIILFIQYIAECQELRYLGSLPMVAPGFSAIYDHGNNVEEVTEKYSIILSTFLVIPGLTEDVNFLWYPGKCLGNPEDCVAEVLGSDFVWPRTPGQIPEQTFGSEKFIYVTDGFIPPTKQDGAIFVCDVRDKNNTVITDITRNADDNREWFYQDALWKDADGDGIYDVFACRTRLAATNVRSEFLWYKNPGGDDSGLTPWEIGLVISEDDCDMFLAETTLTVDGETFDVIFTTGYFMNKLSVHWTSSTWDDISQGLSFSWKQPQSHAEKYHDLENSLIYLVESRVIGTLIDDAICVPGDGLCGHFADIKTVDLNSDGNIDLLATINSGVYGHLVAYEMPADFRTDDFVPIILAEGFIARTGSENQGAPGMLQAFYPSESFTGKPWILLTGDDEGTAYYMVPENQLPNNWNYDIVLIHDAGANMIMGDIIAFDSNGDGFVEIFLSSYSENEIRFYTFAPE